MECYIPWVRRVLYVLLALASLAVLAVGAFTLWLNSTSPVKQRAVFNWIYRHPFGSFTPQPNQLLRETATSLPAGRALDVAMGQGRNALYLAKLGWDVTGFDVSEVALEQAQALAGVQGARIRTLNASSEAFDYGREQWDLIVMSYAYAPIEDAAYVRRLHDALKPGGRLVFEHYVRTFVRRVPGAPLAGELPRLFAGWRIERYEEIEARGDWSFRQQARLARLVAGK
jgi:SAM-dependent methyltransferase